MRKFKHYLGFVYILLSLLLCSCKSAIQLPYDGPGRSAYVPSLLKANSPVYSPPQVNSPMLDEKGKGSISMSHNLGRSRNILGSYAFSNQFAVMGGLNWFDYRRTIESVPFMGVQGDLAIGYYKPIGDGGLFDIYVGGGYAELDSEIVKGPARKITIQPSIGYQGNGTEVSFATRVLYIRADRSVVLTESGKNLESIIIEPTITLSGVQEHFKAYVQLGISRSHRVSQKSDLLGTRPAILYFGFQYHF